MEALRILVEHATLKARATLGMFRVLRVLRVKAACVGLAALAGGTAFVASTLADAARYERHPFAIPAAVTPSIPWEARRAAFADRMTRAFDLPPSVAGEFAEWILEAGQRQELAPELLASLVLAESAFRKNARSSVGAIGPAQVRDDYWRSFCGGDLHEPANNIYCAAQILASFRDRCGALLCALHSYNLGATGARHAYWAPAKARYVAKIQSGLDRFESVTL